MAFASLNGVYSKDSGTFDAKNFIERKLTKIEIPRGVVKVGAYAFANCRDAQSITIPDSVTYIDSNAFNSTGDRAGIEEIIIPDSVTELGVNTFIYSGAKKITVSKNICSFPTGTFQGNSRCISYDFTGYEEVPTLEHVSAFRSINPDADIFVPAELYDEWIVATNWAQYADYIVGVGAGSYGLLDFELNDDCESFSLVGIGTYDSMGELTDLIIPEKHEGLPVTSIAPSAFEGDATLGRVTIPKTVTSIGAAAFSGCTNLAYAYIPESVTSIGASAFADCSGLTEIYFGAAKMADCAISDGVFARAGQSGDGISVVIGKEVEKIPTYLFYGGYPSGSYSSKVTSVEFEEGSVCAEIGDGAFYYCLYLEEFKAPANLERIGKTALYHGEVLDFSACAQVPVLTDSYPWAVTAIYVPAALYDQWIVATNWAQYANKIVAK